MIEKIIRFSVSVILILSFSLGLESGVFQGAYAQEKKPPKKSEQKAPTPAKEKSVKPKPEAQKKDTLSFEAKEYPDGLIGRRYNFVLTPVSATPPYKVTLVSGTLPQGFTLNDQTGGIEGEPSQTGVWNVTLRVVDAKGEKGTFSGSIRVWRPLTVGEHGQFKGFDGLQMALNMAKDMDEIRIEKGVIGASGLVIPENKAWDHGIKISGGWNEAFTGKSEAKKSEVEETGRDYTSDNYTVDDPEATILDGAGKEDRILTISNSGGEVWIDNLTFRNSKGAIEIKSNAVFTNCVFRHNFKANGTGSAVLLSGHGIFNNCTFIDNTATNGGGAVSIIDGSAIFRNCTFWRNYVSGYSGWGSGFGGGAVMVGPRGKVSFDNSTFEDNWVKSSDGGAVFIYGSTGSFNGCIFRNNRGGSGGAVAVNQGTGRITFNNSVFEQNDATNGGAVYGDYNGSLMFSNSAFKENSGSSGGAVLVGINGSGDFINTIFQGNSAKNGGAVLINNDYSGSGRGSFINCVFAHNAVEGEKDNKYYGYGGAINGRGNIFNCTFFMNKADVGGAVASRGGDIINSTFHKNIADDKENDITIIDGSLDIDYSLINYIKGAANFGDHNIMGDPKFVDPDNGDLHLRHDSPPINAGKIVPELKDISTDLDGKPRVYGGKIDIGAYEWHGETIIESKPPSQTSISRSEETKETTSTGGKPPDMEIWFTTPEDGVITEGTTGLQWAQDAGGEAMVWDKANAYVRKLKIGGYSDWRLPTKEELESLLSYCKSKGISPKDGGCADYYNKIGFKNVLSRDYWSSTTVTGDTGNAWIIRMWDGGMVGYFKGHIGGRVWPVRSGKASEPKNPRKAEFKKEKEVERIHQEELVKQDAGEIAQQTPAQNNLSKVNTELSIHTGKPIVSGNPDAPVTMIIYSGYQCPFCGKFFKSTFPEIKKEYIDTGMVRFVYKDFHMAFHKDAMNASIAANCSNEQGKYWEMHDKLFENQKSLGSEQLRQYASEIRLDTVSFNSCFNRGKYNSEIMHDIEEGKKAGITGTPTVFISRDQTKQQK